MGPFDLLNLLNRQSYTSKSSYGSSSSAPSQTPRRYDYWHVPTSAEIAAAVAPTKYAPVDLTKYSCDNPYDLEDLYYYIYYISPKNVQGPYIPQPTDDDIMYDARIQDGRTIWTQGTIPNTSATGCMSQVLMSPPKLDRFFGVQVDGLNKVIIDAYNAQFPNPPTPVPLKTKYFYYKRFINRDTSKEYFPARFTTSFRQSLRLNKNSNTICDDLISDACWGQPQQIPNTNAIGFVIIDGEGQGALMYVRVDRANNAIIEAYNESLNTPLPPGVPQGQEVRPTSAAPPSSSSTSAPVAATSAPAPAPAPAPSTPAPPSSSSTPPTVLNLPLTPAQPMVPAPLSTASTSTPLPPGWEMHTDKKGRTFYAFYVNNDLVSKQWEFPSPLSPASTSTPLPPGWEELKEPSGRVYYGNPGLKIVQLDRPMVYKIGNDTVLSTNELLKKLNLSCPPGTSECDINVVPVATAAAGGSKNKKTSKRRLRSRKASRRKASRNRTCKK